MTHENDMEEWEKPKWLKTGIISTKTGKELTVGAIPLWNEVGIIDEGRAIQREIFENISIYWRIEDTDKIIKKLKEVVK